MTSKKEILLNHISKYANQRLPNTHQVKKRLLNLELLTNNCYECGISSIWNAKPLSLHLDHIDGDACNNNLNNYRLLCPNCHSQTDTYCGKSKKKYIKRNCLECKNPLKSTWSTRCSQCFNKHKNSNIQWPDNEKLRTLIEEYKNLEKLAIELNCSSNAIRKHCKKENIPYTYKRKHIDS